MWCLWAALDIFSHSIFMVCLKVTRVSLMGISPVVSSFVGNDLAHPGPQGVCMMDHGLSGVAPAFVGRSLLHPVPQGVRDRVRFLPHTFTEPTGSYLYCLIAPI